MAAKKKTGLFFALLTLLVSTAAFASIPTPNNTLLSPEPGRDSFEEALAGAIESTEPAEPTEVVRLGAHLRVAAARVWPREYFPKTRVWGFFGQNCSETLGKQQLSRGNASGWWYSGGEKRVRPVRFFDNYTAAWSMTPAEWNALLGSGETRASSLSIAVTDTLRASGWDRDAVVLPAPAWATTTKPVFTSAALPVEVRESVSALDTWLGAAASGTETAQTLYEVDELAAMVGSSSSTAGHPERLLVAASFHAHPFHEPLTGMNYVRARWMNPQLGVFLSPDPLGYQDSSNLYAFAGGDPVNGRDPTGLACEGTGLLSRAVGCYRDYRQAVEFGGDLMVSLGTHPIKNFKRAAGGLLGAGKMVVDTVVETGQIAFDNSNLGRAVDPVGTTIRNVQRVQGAKQLARHPIATLSEAKRQNEEKIIRHEARGELVLSGMTAGEKASGDTLALIGAIEGGAGLLRAGRSGIRSVSVLDDLSFEFTAADEAAMLDQLGALDWAPPKAPKANVLANKAAGDAWEAIVLSDVLPLTQENIEAQVTIRSRGPSGLRVRLDAIGEEVLTGDIRLTDAKASATAPLTPNQVIVYPELEIWGGIVTGRGKGIFTRGMKIPPAIVDIIRKP